MDVKIVACLEDNYAYVLHDGRRAIVVDPSEEAPVRAALAGLELTAIWCTHHHGDHVGGVEPLAAPEVFGSAYDLEHQRIPGQTRGLSDGESFTALGETFRVLFVPGHTLGAIAYVGAGLVFTGDTLFQAGCGRLFEGDAPMLHASLAKLSALDPKTRVYCGHEYAAKNLRFAATVAPSDALRERTQRVTAQRARGEPSVPTLLADELATNPFLRVDAAEFARRRVLRDTF